MLWTCQFQAVAYFGSANWEMAFEWQNVCDVICVKKKKQLHALNWHQFCLSSLENTETETHLIDVGKTKQNKKRTFELFNDDLLSAFFLNDKEKNNLHLLQTKWLHPYTHLLQSASRRIVSILWISSSMCDFPLCFHASSRTEPVNCKFKTF